MKFPGAPLPPHPTAKQRADHDRAFKAWAAAEAERVRRQRIYLTTLSGPVSKNLVAKMLDRAWALLDAGEAEAADAILEFVPEAKATALLDEFFKDDLG